MNSVIYAPSDTMRELNVYSYDFPQTTSSLYTKVKTFVDREYNKLKENREKLIKFSRFENKWDGYNGVKISTKVIKKVENIIENLVHQVNIFPVGNGSIQLEYYKDENNCLELEVSDSQKASLYYSINGKDTEQIIDNKDIVLKLNELYKYYE